MLRGNILITGGSGTLGHAILTTARREGWDCSFTIYSRSESRQAAMRTRFPEVRYILGDVRDYDRLAGAIAGHDAVIHAAAMKRLPECEAQPTECMRTNVLGTMNVARACLWNDVTTAIFISTDKACKAITTYGASKLAGEGIWRAHAPHARFVAVRYGNVVASTGSVIPIWRDQAARGEPLTITDRRCTRFWMAPSDAVKLIEHAAALQSGEIAVPAMAALSLPDLAEIVAPDAKIIETGLRATEKLHEDLIHLDEEVSQWDQEGPFVLGPGGTTGTSYTSENAPRLMAWEFRQMLAEAEGLE